MKKLWKSLDEHAQEHTNLVTHINRSNTSDNIKENLFDDETYQLTATRRDFLKLFGFSVASAAIAASCEQPVRKAIPYLTQPEEILPGKSISVTLSDAGFYAHFQYVLIS